MARSIREVQEALRDEGYDIGPDGADGVGGANTRKALAEFQLNNGLPQTNRVDVATLRLLFPDDFPRNAPMKNILGSIWSGLLGNLFRSQAAMGYIRNLLIAFGSTTGVAGYVGNDGWALIVGALMTIIGVVLDAISNSTKQKAMDVVKAVDAAPGVTVIPAAQTADKKPDVIVTK